jgi:alpha-tubulin suppressor-like RCC1 family protein
MVPFGIAMTRLLLLLIAWPSCLAAHAQLSAYYAIPASSSTWTTYSVPLLESAGWTMGSTNGPVPSQSEFLGILNFLSGLTISFDASPQISLDNVSFANLATSTFPNCSSDGWMDGDNRGPGCNSLIGNPPGSINNGAVLAVFNAPTKYLGNQVAAYGGNLSFDLMGNGTGHVILTAIPNPSLAAAASVIPWGDNYSGQMNIGAGSTNIAGIAAGRYHSLALKTDGTVETCGWNTYAAPDFLLSASQLNPSQTNLPTGLSNAVAVASGAYHNLVLRSDGTVIAWGNNVYNQTNVPVGLTNVAAVASGDYHCLALRSDGTVVAWGSTNYVIQDGRTNYGVNNFGQSSVPSNLSNVVAVAGGGLHSLALRADGTLVAWGRNNFGQTNVPPGLTNVVAIAAGSSHNLALREDGSVIAWGLNTSGQTNVPSGLSNVVAVAAGSFFSLALRADGTVVAWGHNTFYETNLPTGLTNVNAIAGGGYHALALMGDGPPLLQATLLNPNLSLNGFKVSLPSHSGRVYRFEYKNSLADADWIGLPLSAGTGGTLTLTDLTVSNSQRFYRVRRW